MTNIETSNQSYQNVYFALKMLLHLTATAHFWYGMYYEFSFIPTPNDFGGKFRYLTVIGAITQTVYYTLCLLNDFAELIKNHSKKVLALRKFKDYLFATFAFPLAVIVCLTFWGIYAVDRELIFPKAFEAIYPNWLNHMVHTNVMIFALLEMCVSFREYPNRKLGLISLFIFIMWYIIWVHIIKYKSDHWVYPVLGAFNLLERILFLTFMCIAGLCIYFVGEFLNKIIWAKQLRRLKRSKRHRESGVYVENEPTLNGLPIN